MKTKITLAYFCRYRNSPNAACRRLPRCLVCGRVLSSITAKRGGKFCEACQTTRQAASRGKGVRK